MQAVAEQAKARGDHSAAHFLSGAALLLDDDELHQLKRYLK